MNQLSKWVTDSLTCHHLMERKKNHWTIFLFYLFNQKFAYTLMLLSSFWPACLVNALPSMLVFVSVYYTQCWSELLCLLIGMTSHVNWPDKGICLWAGFKTFRPNYASIWLSLPTPLFFSRSVSFTLFSFTSHDDLIFFVYNICHLCLCWQILQLVYTYYANKYREHILDIKVLLSQLLLYWSQSVLVSPTSTFNRWIH